MNKLERLQRKTSFLVLLAESVKEILLSSVNFGGIKCIRNVAAYELSGKRITTLNVSHVKIGK